MVFPVVMYGCESWTVKKPERQRIDAFELWCWRRLLRVLGCKVIQPVHSEGGQPWDFFGGNDADAETPVLWPPHAKSWLIGKDSDAGRDWGQEEKGMTENEMAGWHHWLDGRESEWTPGVGDGQGAWCASIHGVTKSRTRMSDWTELNWKVFPGFPGGSGDKQMLAVQETEFRSLGWEDPLEREMATYSSILAREILWRKAPVGLQSKELGTIKWLQQMCSHWEVFLTVYLRLKVHQFSSVQFSRSVVSNSLQSHGLQCAMLPCSSPTPGASSNSGPSSWWCHPTISSSVVPFSCFQSFPASGSFPVSLSLHQVAKLLELQFQSFQCIFRTDFL